MEKKEKKERIKDITLKQASIAFNLYTNWLKEGWIGRPLIDQEIRAYLFDITKVLYLRKEITSDGKIMLAFYRDIDDKCEPFSFKTWISDSGKFFRKDTVYRWVDRMWERESCIKQDTQRRAEEEKRKEMRW